MMSEARARAEAQEDEAPVASREPDQASDAPVREVAPDAPEDAPEDASEVGSAQGGLWGGLSATEKRLTVVSVLVPLLVYVPFIPLDITRGDGPELLTAIMTLGVAHPSGYPLFTLLGQIPARLPFGSPSMNATIALCALPAALTSGVLFRTMRRLDVGWAVALLSAWLFAFNYRVMFQAVRLEVYALHCLFTIGTLYAMVRHLEDRQPRWLYLATLCTSLGLTNHLTSAFLIPVVVVGGLLADWRGLLRARVVATCLAIGAACGLIYGYFPWSAAANLGDRVTWNDPQTLERFWFHVTGKEYQVFRSKAALSKGMSKFFHDINGKMFPGILLLSGLGLYELARRNWRLVVLLAGMAVPLLLYVSTYTINDISTYYPPLYMVALLLAGVGVHWLVEARLPRAALNQRAVAFALGLSGLVGAVVAARGLYYEDRINGQMATQVMDAMPEKAILFTSIDGHTFPMWYRAYVDHPEKNLVVVDTVMFGLKNKQWYRDWLRKKHPDVKWPSDAIALSGSHWRGWIVRNNRPKYRSFAILYSKWPQPAGFLTYNRGWFHEIVPKKEKPGVRQDRQNLAKYIYTSRHRRVNGRHYFYASATKYARAEDAVACMVEWFDEHPKVTADWVFHGPNGAKHEVRNHAIPTGSNMSWEYLPVDKQTPGEWTCEVTFRGAEPLRSKFVIEP